MPGFSNEVNVLNPSGVAMGDGTTPVRVDPTGTTPQPTDATRVNGNPIATGTGASTTGTQRVAVSTDSSMATMQDRANTSQSLATQTLNAAVSQAVNGCGSAGVFITGGTSPFPGSGVVTFEATIDGTNWFATNAIVPTTGAIVTTTTTTGQWIVPCAGYAQIRLRVSTAGTSNTATVSIEGSAGTQAVSIANTAPVNISQYGGTSTTLGQKAMASSAPVVIASDQTNVPVAPDVSGTGTLNALNATAQVACAGLSSALLQLANGNMVATIIAEVSYDNAATWNQSVFLDLINDKRAQTFVFTIGTNPSVIAAIPLMSGTTHARVRVSAYTSGTANARMEATCAVMAPVVDSIPRRATYSAAILNLASAASATDIFTISGAAGKMIRVIRIEISGTQTTAGEVNIQLIKRSSVDTAGTSTTLTNVVHDTGDPAASATVLAYTANPTLGNTVGAVRVSKLSVPTSTGTTAPLALIWDFGDIRGTKPIKLLLAAQQLAVNLNATTITGGSFNISIEWTEE